MRSLLFALALLAFSANATVTANAAGKTLDQFFVMAAQVFSKALIVDPAVNGTLKVYGVGNGNFQKVFYSILRAHDLGYMETDDVIRVYLKSDKDKPSTVTDRQSLYDYIASSVSDVYISGSMSYYKAGSEPRYEYAFIQGQSRNVFSPESIGLKVVAVHSCLAQLRFDTYTTFVTCEPYRTPEKPEEQKRESIRSIFDDRGDTNESKNNKGEDAKLPN